ncbi:MAG: prephenate dehydrogenase [Candidatus Brocadiaceae bacterium]|nr:prephenate dehydrogenase [Candidatus Brocadiaceae bacterium]
MRFETVCIIGPGLIGGSIGLGLKKRNLTKKVIGVGHKTSTIKDALKIGAIDVGNLSAENAVKEADIIILATSVNKIVEIARHVIPYMKRRAILTDVGSTKSYIVEQITSNIRKDIAFVGAHPIAGSEKKGINHASPNLFEGCTCFVTPFRNHKSDLKTISDLWHCVGAKVRRITPERHDEILASVSHLPHLIASCLINIIKEKDIIYGASGLKDTTRIASGDPELWRDIFDQNHKNMIKSIDLFIKELSRFRNDILQKNNAMIFDRLKNAKLLRDEVFHNNSTNCDKNR